MTLATTHQYNSIKIQVNSAWPSQQSSKSAAVSITAPVPWRMTAARTRTQKQCITEL